MKSSMKSYTAVDSRFMTEAPSDVNQFAEYMMKIPEEEIKEINDKNVRMSWAVLFFQCLLFPVFGFIFTKANRQKKC